MPPLNGMDKRLRDTLLTEHPFTVRAMCRKGMSLDSFPLGLGAFSCHNEVRKDLRLALVTRDSDVKRCMYECEFELRARFYKDLRG